MIGVARPSVVVSATDQTARTLLSLAQVEGRELAKRGDWEELMSEGTFNTVASTESYALTSVASDFDHIINGSMWNRDTDRQVRGPLSAQDWQAVKSDAVSSSPFQNYRIRGGNILLYPTPSAAESIYFEYVSKNWCQDSGSTGQAAWAADDDTGVLDENLMALGIVWRYLRKTGMDYSEQLRDYESQVQKALGRSGGAAVLRMGSRIVDPVLYPANIPVTGYGS